MHNNILDTRLLCLHSTKYVYCDCRLFLIVCFINIYDDDAIPISQPFTIQKISSMVYAANLTKKNLTTSVKQHTHSLFLKEQV